MGINTYTIHQQVMLLDHMSSIEQLQQVAEGQVHCSSASRQVEEERATLTQSEWARYPDQTRIWLCACANYFLLKLFGRQLELSIIILRNHQMIGYAHRQKNRVMCSMVGGNVCLSYITYL